MSMRTEFYHAAQSRNDPDQPRIGDWKEAARAAEKEAARAAEADAALAKDQPPVNGADSPSSGQLAAEAEAEELGRKVKAEFENIRLMRAQVRADAYNFASRAYTRAGGDPQAIPPHVADIAHLVLELGLQIQGMQAAPISHNPDVPKDALPEWVEAEMRRSAIVAAEIRRAGAP